MPVMVTEGLGATLPGFARVLSETAPDVFGTAENILEIFRVADEEFCNDPAIRLSPSCTSRERAFCWAVDRQRAWNELFNRRGVELVQLHRGTLTFRTLDVDPDSLPRDDDVKFLCLYLWLLCQHRCLAEVTLSVPVLAPRHQALFTSLLMFTENVRKCEVRGCYPLSASPLNGQPRVTALGNLSMLTELGLAAMHLSSTDGALLVHLVEKNSALAALILIDVLIEAIAFAELISKVVEHKRLDDFRLKMTINEPDLVYTDALSLLGKAGLARLHVDVDCNLLPLLRSLVGNEALVDVTIATTIVDLETLTALAEITNVNVALKRLKAKVDIGKFPQMRGVQHELFRLAGSSKLHTLVVSGSTLTPELMSSLADGVNLSRSLKEVHLDGCNLTCADVAPFIRHIGEGNCGFEELNVGSLKGSDQERRQLLKLMMNANVCHKVTCVYHDCQIGLLSEALDSHATLSKLSLECGESTEVEPLLRSLRSTLKTLRYLSIVAQRPLSNLGGQFLAHVLRKSDILKVVRLRCRTKPGFTIQVLKGLADSKSVTALTIEHWDMKENVQRTFVDMMRQNRSIRRLEFYWKEHGEYTAFKEALVKGLALNQNVSTLKMYQGAKRDEIYDNDLLKHIHRNQMVLSWSVDIILRDDMCLEGAALLDALKYCDVTLDLLEREVDSSPRTAMNGTRAALMATRSGIYALLDAFSCRKNFTPTPDGRLQLDVLGRLVLDEVVDIVGFDQMAR